MISARNWQTGYITTSVTMGYLNDLFGYAIIISFACRISLAQNKISYDGYYVVRFAPDATEKGQWLISYLKEHNLEIWQLPSNPSIYNVDVLFSPDDKNIFDFLSSEVSWQITVPDVERQIKLSQKSDHELSSANDRFYNLTELEGFLDEAYVACGADCELITIGQSYEGRDLRVLKLTRPGTDRRAVFLDSTMHAREWLSPAVVRCFIDKLVYDDGSDSDVTLMRDLFDWYILFIVNPDGYEYSWTTDRLWRKTRSPNSGSSCAGTDINRNFDVAWGDDLGSSGDPCSIEYRGSAPRSEVEVAAYTEFALSINHTVDLIISYHTYGQVLYAPWSWTNDEPVDLPDLNLLANVSVTAINANSNVTYDYRNGYGDHPLDHPSSGTGTDWWKAFAGVKYSYVMEMRDEGYYNFLAPPEVIQPTCDENWAGLYAMAVDLASKR